MGEDEEEQEEEEKKTRDKQQFLNHLKRARPISFLILTLCGLWEIGSIGKRPFLSWTKTEQKLSHARLEICAASTNPPQIVYIFVKNYDS